MGIDKFNRGDLIGNQSINTINNFDDYLQSLLNPFNNTITSLKLELNSININKEVEYSKSIINSLQIENATLLSQYTLIDQAASIQTQCDNYIIELTTKREVLTSVLNSKAQINTPLLSPTLTTVIPTNNNSAVTRQYVTNKLLSYTLPSPPIPNTRLYVNRSGTGFIWA
jgi:hypothetical protein